MSIQTPETPSQLKPETIEGLQDLLQANIDSARGFEEVASDVTDPSVKPLCEKLAKDRHAQSGELVELIRTAGEKPQNDGSWLAAYHRTWIATKAALTSGDSASLLTEVIRGENYLSDRYQSVIKETSGSAVNDVLHRQYAAVLDSLKCAEAEKAKLDA